MKLLLTVALIGLTALPAAALEPIAQNTAITGKLVAARIADRIRRECDRIDARLIYAYSEARGLKRDAERMGYSSAQIDAFLDSNSERARIYADAERWLAGKGAKSGDAASFCRVGQGEIAAKTYIGSFLRAR
ncbi:DUF5333 domain-containing protein [Paracoccus sp. p3-h83]|uniref:DUF5333 domain-containing protein n=1 Tax=Paracoccus sp. p3-h83 TaxID=3342805 RepID=UPI0035BB43E5